MARDILDYHVRAIADPQAKLEAARELMQTIVAIETPSPYAQVLREHMERMLRYSTALLFHDDLAEISTPFYFHEFVEHAEQHRLAFLSEADLFESQMRDVPESAGRLMDGLPDDVVVREQYLDFFKNRMFRQTLLCHVDAPVTRALDDAEIERFAVSSQAREGEGPQESRGDGGANRTTETSAGLRGAEEPKLASTRFATPEGYTVTTSEPLVQGAMRALGETWPRALSFQELLERGLRAAGAETQEKEEKKGEQVRAEQQERVRVRLRAVLLQAYLARVVMLQGCVPPLANSAGERPLASPLARAQCAAGLEVVSSLLHANARLEGEIEARVLMLLDGTRDRAELLVALSASGKAPSPDELEQTLIHLAGAGLLQG
jgi:hypothetical protein